MLLDCDHGFGSQLHRSLDSSNGKKGGSSNIQTTNGDIVGFMDLQNCGGELFFKWLSSLNMGPKVVSTKVLYKRPVILKCLQIRPNNSLYKE